MIRQAGCLFLSVLLLLFLTACSGNNQQHVDDHPFDFYIDMTTKDDIERLADEPFVEGVFPFTLMIFQRPGYTNSQMGQIAVLAAPSFEGLEYSPFNSTYLKDEDPTIMQDIEKNPILIDEALAKAERLKVGDVLYQESKASDEVMEFTVAGIYRHTSLFAQYEAVALINNQILRIFSEIVDEMGYTNAYVKATDLTLLKAFFDEEFIPQLQLKGMSEEEIAVIPEEDLKAYYEEYDDHMNRMK
jgi:hypothetical protein